MPVRIENIPNLNVQDGFAVPRVDARAASAPGRAMGAVANAIAGVGGVFEEIGLRAQEATNQAKALEIESGWRRQAADFEISLQQEPDPVKRVEEMNKFLAEQQKALSDPDLPPSMLGDLRKSFGAHADRVYIGTKMGAERLTRDRLTQATNNALEEATSEDEVRSIHSRAVAGGVAIPEDLPKWERAAREKREDRDADIETETDPDGFLDRNSGPPPAGVDHVKYYRRLDNARRNLANQTADAARSVQDLIADGKITTDEQLEAATQDLRPAVREEMKGYMHRYWNAESQRERSTDAYISQTAAEVQQQVDVWEPQLEGSDASWVRMANLVRTLPANSAVRDDLERQMAEKRQGSMKDMSSSVRQVQAFADHAFKSGAFGTWTQEKSLQSVIDDGFLKDSKKLQTFGFSEDQANAITTLNSDALTKTGIDKVTQEKILKTGGDAARMDVFQALIPQRKGESTAGEFETEAFRAIQDRKGPSAILKSEDAQQKKKSYQAYGNVIVQLQNWAKANPEDAKDYNKAMEKLYEFSGESARQAFSGSFIEPAPADADEDIFVLPPKTDR